MKLKFKGNEILENKTLQDLLINVVDKVNFVRWNEGSYTDGLGKELNIKLVNENICITDGLWSKEIDRNAIIGVNIEDVELNKIFTSFEIASLFKKDEKSIRYYIKSGVLERNKDYRKAGRINLISVSSMEKIYGNIFSIRLSDLVGLKWKYLTNEEKEYLLNYSNCYFQNDEVDGKCLVDFYNSNLSVSGYLNPGDSKIIIDDESILNISEIRKFKLYYITVKLDNWDYFKEVDKEGYINNFFFVNGMNKGDKAIFHISKDAARGVHGVYAWGTIVGDPEIVTDKSNYCYGKKAIDIRFDKISKDIPLITHEDCTRYINIFMNNHKVSDKAQYEIVDLLDIK